MPDLNIDAKFIPESIRDLQDQFKTMLGQMRQETRRMNSVTRDEEISEVKRNLGVQRRHRRGLIRELGEATNTSVRDQFQTELKQVNQRIGMHRMMLRQMSDEDTRYAKRRAIVNRGVRYASYAVFGATFGAALAYGRAGTQEFESNIMQATALRRRGGARGAGGRGFEDALRGAAGGPGVGMSRSEFIDLASAMEAVGGGLAIRDIGGIQQAARVSRFTGLDVGLVGGAAA